MTPFSPHSLELSQTHPCSDKNTSTNVIDSATNNEEALENENECCPICYEPYIRAAPPIASSAAEEESRFPTTSIEEESGSGSTTQISDYPIDSENDGDNEVSGTEIDIEIGTRPQQPRGISSPCSDDSKTLICKTSSNSNIEPSLPNASNIVSHPCPETKTESPRCYHHPREQIVIPACGHGFCRRCLRSHCSYAVSIRDLPIRCPRFSIESCRGGPCSLELPMAIIKESLLQQLQPPSLDLQQGSPQSVIEIEPFNSNSVGAGETSSSPPQSMACSSHDSTHKTPANSDWLKFQRFHKMWKDPSLIPCTRCDNLISPEDVTKNNTSISNGTSSESNDCPNRVFCSACKHVFCRIHGDAHPGNTCSDAQQTKEQRVADHLEKLSEALVHESCKPCSHCRVPISKVEDSCNHVVCPVCKKDMCFKCATHLHLESVSPAVRGCKQCKGAYIDHRKMYWHRLGVALKLPFLLPIYLGYMAMTLSLAVATFGCFCCLGCGVRYKNERKSKQKRQATKKTNSIVWMPLMAVKEVLGWLLLPFIDLFRECRIPCCFCGDAPGLCQGRRKRDDDDDYDGYYDSDEDDDDGYDESQLKTAKLEEEDTEKYFEDV